MLELVNRARANPAAEGQRLVALTLTNPVLQVATQGWDLGKFLSTISAYGSEPPLALNTRLIEAARDHDGAMLAANTQFHAPSGYLTNPQVAHAADGQAYYPTSFSSWATGENIFAYSSNVSGDVTAYVDYFEAAFLLDWGNPDFGHLTNLLAPGPGGWNAGAGHYPYSEIGIGLLTGVTPTVPPGPNNQGFDVGPDIVTQEFGWRSGNPILTGCFYLDKNSSNFYAPGEGFGGVTITAVGKSGQGMFQTTTWSSGGYSLPLPPGSYTVIAAGANLPYPISTTVSLSKDNVGWEYVYKPTVQADQPVPGDYGGSGRAGLAVYRASTGQWFVDGQSSPTAFGGPGLDIPLPGNYDGVGHAELAVYRPSTAQWFVLGPGGGKLLATFGAARRDIPIPGDYDGVGHSEVAVYRPSTAQWFVLGPGGGRLLATFGAANLDIPVPGDYDGVGHAEPAVYRPTTGQWFVLGPHGGRLVATLGGSSRDIPEPGDYDGVGRLEPAVFRPSTAQWFILGPSGTRSFRFGATNLDMPLEGDFDGDGKADPALYRPTTGQWFALLSGGGVLVRQFGQGGTSSSASRWLAGYSVRASAQATQSLVIPQAETEGSVWPAHGCSRVGRSRGGRFELVTAAPARGTF